MFGLPGEDTVRSVLALATRAPSVHNSQPWRWLVGDGRVYLYADRTRQLHATDPYGHELLLSCGAALHHLRVAFAAAGWSALVHRLPDPADPDRLASVLLEPHQVTAEDMDLAAAVRARRTDRRRYGSWQVPPRMLSLLAERAAAEGAVLRAVLGTEVRYRLVCAMAEAAELQTADPAYATELAAWTGRQAGEPDGVPAANIPPISGRYGDLPMPVFPRSALDQPQGSADSDDAGVLLVLAAAGDDRLSLLRSGEALSAVLLAATRMGLATCPLSPVLEVGCTRDLVRMRVLNAATYPHAVLRVGRAVPTAEPLPATPRRPVRDVVEHLAGEPAPVRRELDRSG
jgi:nitroreductase